MKIKITTLSENTARGRYLGEWGLSILVEVDGKKILFDTGQSFSAVHNAKIMGFDLTSIDKIVLSHGHYDHTGGLAEILKIKGQVEVIAHPDVWESKCAIRSNGEEDYIGIPFSRKELENLGANFVLSEKPSYITDCIVTTGEIPMTTDYEQVEDEFVIKENNRLIKDLMTDDQALVIIADFGVVVVTGCAHRGIINTIRHAQKLSGSKPLYMVVGGYHLLNASAERIEKTISDLRETGIQYIGVSHCTGFAASARLAEEFGYSFFHNNTGTVINLPII